MVLGDERRRLHDIRRRRSPVLRLRGWEAGPRQPGHFSCLKFLICSILPPLPEAPVTQPLLDHDPSRPFRWLYLDFNSFFASVEQQEYPELRGRPIGILASPGENTCTIAASIEARPFGVKTGTPLREARRLCPDIVFRPARHELYTAYHRRILAELDRHLPVERVWSIDEVSARLLGPQRRPEAAFALARAIKSGLAERIGPCLRCSIGLAPSRHLAKLATELQKPDGLVALRPEDLPGPLLHLPLRDIPGIGRRMAARLARCGITDMAGLWDLGPKRARQIWNSVEGERFWYGLRGADLPEPQPPAIPRSIGHARVLPPGLREAEAARHVTRLLAMKATARLRSAATLATLLILHVEPARGSGTHEHGLQGETRLRQTDDDRVVLAELGRLWSQLPPGRYWRVSVTLAGLVPAAGATPDLLDWAAGHSAPRLSEAMARIHRRFGRDSLLFGPSPRDRDAYAAQKIAFSRVPD
jgi:DNA polymerase-4